MLPGIATLSYYVAGFAFLFLSVLLLTKWRNRLHGKALTTACCLTSLWALTISWQIAHGYPLLPLVTDILEILRSAGWLYFLLILLGPFQETRNRIPFNLKPSVAAISAFLFALIIATSYAYIRPASALTLGIISGTTGRVTLAVIGMLLVEQLFRNTPSKDRWGIKFACLGIGGLFAYDFYLYSDAMLFKRINPEIWIARGVIDALTVPLIAISTARNPKWSLGLAVSRRVLFHSAALFGSAIYLLAMAAAGYYLRFFGGSWGTIMQMAFLFGAIILLFSVLFSGAFRAWLKVFISKHFYTYNYDYREEWMRFTRTLSEDGHALGERTIQAVATLVESPEGLLWINRESGYCEPAAHWNMEVISETEPVNSTLCQFLETKQWVIDLQEYALSPEKYEGIVVPQWLQDCPRAWLIVPLILHGKLFGFMLLAKPRSSISLNWEVIDLLKIAGSQAASYLAKQESANALMVARQFESFNRMSTFVVHDLKNLVSQLSLLMSNAEKFKDRPEFQKDMLETIDYSVQKMRLLLHKLSRETSVEHPASLLIEKLLQQAVAIKSASIPKPSLEISASGLHVMADWARLERVIGHLIQNAIEATPRHGSVVVRLVKEGNSAIVEVEDTGQGMSEEFIRERLFKPFESTKSAGMGIGVFETREYVHELGGILDVTSRESSGTVFRLILPLANANQDSNAFQKTA